MIICHFLTLAFGCISAGCGETGASNPSRFDVNALPDAVVGTAYSENFIVSGGTAPYFISLTSGTLPDGLSLSGVNVSGTPTRVGQFGFQIAIEDSSNPPQLNSATVSIFVQDPASNLQIFTSSLPVITQGTTYDSRVLITGGTKPYQFAVTDGALPAGVKLDATTGTLKGTATQPGHHVFDLQVSDAANTSRSKRLSITVSSSASDRPSITAIASRTSGPAPLHVSFDARQTTSSRHSNAYHHLDYQWSFGELNAARQRSSGPLTAHTFDTPGQYIVQLAVMDPDGRTSAHSFTIQVDDPDTVFAGTKTYCFSNDTDFTGAPTGAVRITTNNFTNEINKHYGSNRRLLFKRGDRFRGYYTSVSGQGPVQIGAFGSGTNPDSRGLFSNDPIVDYPDSNSGITLEGSNLTISNINFQNPTQDGYFAVLARKPAREFHILRCRFVGFQSAGGFDHSAVGNRTPHTLCSFTDCDFSRIDGMALFCGGHKLAFIGNKFDTTNASHHIRLTYANGVVIDRNEFLNLTGGVHALKIHAAHDKAIHGRWAEDIVIRENLFNTACGWTVAIAPENAITNDELKDIIIEKNTFYSRPGCATSIYLACRDTTVRNNLFLGAGSYGSDFYAVQVERRGVEPSPSGIEVYSNTRFNNQTGPSRDYMLLANNHQGAVVLKNNIVWSTAASRSRPFESSGGSTISKGGNIITDPDFEDASNNNFRLKTASTARGKGVAIPVVDDRDGLRRLPTSQHPGCHAQ